MGDLVGALVGGVLELVRASWGAAFRSGRHLEGRRRAGWATMAAACCAAALFVPMLVGSFFLAEAALDLAGDDMFFFLGLLLLMPAFVLVGFAVASVGFGVTVGAWLLVDRPLSRLIAGLLAVVTGGSGGFLVYTRAPVAQVVGWATVGLAGLLLLLVSLPRAELRVSGAEPVEGGSRKREVAPEIAAAVAARRRTKRFVL